MAISPRKPPASPSALSARSTLLPLTSIGNSPRRGKGRKDGYPAPRKAPHPLASASQGGLCRKSCSNRTPNRRRRATADAAFVPSTTSTSAALGVGAAIRIRVHGTTSMVAVEVGVPSPSARRVERSGEDGASRFYSSAVRIHLHSSISIAPVSRSCPPPANNNCCCAKSTCLARRRMTKRYVLCLDPHPPIPILTPHSILRSKHCDPHSRNTRQRAYTVTVPSLDWCTLYRASLDLDHRWEGKADAASPPWEPRATALEGHADSVYCLELSRTRQPQEGASSELFAAWAPGDGETRLHVGPVDGAPGRGRTWRVAACWICGWTSGGLLQGHGDPLVGAKSTCSAPRRVRARGPRQCREAAERGLCEQQRHRQGRHATPSLRKRVWESSIFWLVDDGTHGRQCKRRGQGLRVAGAIGALKSSLLYAHLRLNCISGDDERMSERSSEHEFRGRGVLERRLSLACRPCEVFHSVRLIAMSSMDDPYGTDRFLKSSVAAAHAMSITLNASNPLGPPLIDPGLLASDFDVLALHEGITSIHLQPS
ncbi:hypothetical protein B0H11DRAFT_2244182 [Mycena galericulata]|nr:hypothetical protein B0H11DRAFT_2244182 [Mycena galericulata]